MNTDGGQITIGTAIDLTGFEQGMEQLQSKVSELGANVDAQGQRMQELLGEPMRVNINISDASQSLATISQALTQCYDVIDANTAACKELEKANKELGRSERSVTEAGREEYKTIVEAYKLRKSIIKETKEMAQALSDAEDKLLAEAQAATNVTEKQKSFRTELMNAKNEMKQMVAAGQQNTEAYEQVRQKVVELTQAQNAANKQVNAFSAPTAQYQGILSGLSGISGALTAATGAMGLFAGENEDLQKIMTKLQSVMAITMGLQQMETSLNKNSAFQLVTLNGLKEWWNELCEIGKGNTAEEAVAIAEETAEQVKNTAATVADTAAQGLNNTATTAGTVATGANTAAQAANTTAAVAGTAANITLAGAFRMVAAAIKSLLASIPVLGWVALGVTALIEAVSWLTSENEEANKEFEEQEELLKQSRETYAKAKVEIEDYTAKINNFNGTKEQEKQLVEELNNKYGSALGYYDSLSQWKDVLKQKGEAYCQMLLKEAEAQAILNKYTEAFIAVQETKDKVANGDYKHWYQSAAADKEDEEAAVAAAQATADKYMAAYKQRMQEAQSLRDQFDMNTHVKPTATKTTSGGRGGRSTTGSTFDAAKAKLQEQEAIEEWRDAVKDYLKEANEEIVSMQIEAQEDGMIKELNANRLNTDKKCKDWNDQLRRLAEVRKNALREMYMAQEGATDVGWANSDAGKKSIDEYMQTLLEDEELAKNYYSVYKQIVENGEAEAAAIRKKYRDELIAEYGTDEQKESLQQEQWTKLLNNPAMTDDMRENVIKAMDEAFAKMDADKFKAQINWDGVFGNLDDQSLQSLQYTLDKVKSYFNANKESMGTEEIKEFSEAIANMEDEIASRNPFTAFHKSIKDIAKSKDELITAMEEWKTAQQEVTTAQQEYNEAKEYLATLQEQVSAGTLAEKSDEYASALERVNTAQTAYAKATSKSANAETNVLQKRNNLTNSYKSFATQLKNVGSTVTGVGQKAKNLASVFSDDVADGIGEALDCVDEVLDATSSVISAIGDVGKNVASGVESTVQETASGTTAAAAAGATAISTIEKASVILAVISAALQVATAIANLFNNDDDKQEEIEKLQERIDQLQWELDNADAVRLQENMGDAVERVKNTYNQVYNAIKEVHEATVKYTSIWSRLYDTVRMKAEAYKQTVEKLADAYASADYTADKLLGENKYSSARKELENLAEQQLLLNQQMEKEQDKKHTDDSKVNDYKEQIAEVAEEMASVINDMMEEIIGYSAEDLASELGDAFFDAVSQGEDAMEQWHTTAKSIVADILKQMLVTKLLEEPIGEIFNKYKKKWFGTDGTFKGIDTVISSMEDFSADLDAVGSEFESIYDALPDTLKDMLLDDDAERDGTSKGIATASQESVDENNARLTTIQGHTYTLVQGMGELNRTSTAILDKVSDIEKHTNETNTKLDTMNNRIKNVESTVDDIYTKGIKLKS